MWDRLAGLLADLGVAPQSVGVWYGQVLQWQQLYHRAIRGEGVVLAINGRMRDLEPGRLRLVARSWTIQMEDGPYLYLELLPEVIGPAASTLNKLLGETSLQGVVFGSLGIEILLEPGYAYVLTGESPAVEWQPRADTAEPQPTAESEPVVVLPDGPAVGPTVVAPDTLGEFLFAGVGKPARRTILVFVPRIPKRLLSPYSVSSRTSPAPEHQNLANSK